MDLPSRRNSRRYWRGWAAQKGLRRCSWSYSSSSTMPDSSWPARSLATARPLSSCRWAKTAFCWRSPGTMTASSARSATSACPGLKPEPRVLCATASSSRGPKRNSAATATSSASSRTTCCPWWPANTRLRSPAMPVSTWRTTSRHRRANPPPTSWPVHQRWKWASTSVGWMPLSCATCRHGRTTMHSGVVVPAGVPGLVSSWATPAARPTTVTSMTSPGR